jgi:hypothetical protein
MNTTEHRTKAWVTQLNPSTQVRWDPAIGWTVGGQVLPEGPHAKHREWMFAVYAWQEAMCESFHQLNEEVRELRSQVAALKPKGRR